MIGIDETRTRRVRWVLGDNVWRRSDPWMTSIVDLDPAHVAGIIGLAPGRTGACVTTWLGLQTPAFRDGIKVVAIDPFSPYAAGIRRPLPGATIVLDHFHLVLLANQMLTEVRQRVAWEQHGHRGTRVDPAWAHRRLLLTSRGHPWPVRVGRPSRNPLPRKPGAAGGRGDGRLHRAGLIAFLYAQAVEEGQCSGQISQ